MNFSLKIFAAQILTSNALKFLEWSDLKFLSVIFNEIWKTYKAYLKVDFFHSFKFRIISFKNYCIFSNDCSLFGLFRNLNVIHVKNWQRKNCKANISAVNFNLKVNPMFQILSLKMHFKKYRSSDHIQHCKIATTA